MARHMTAVGTRHGSSSLREWLLLARLCFFAPAAAAQTFVDVTELRGADAGPQTTYGNPIRVDFDADGLLDLFVVNHGGVPTPLRNRGDGTFRKARPGSKITATGDRRGAAWGTTTTMDCPICSSLSAPSGRPRLASRPTICTATTRVAGTSRRSRSWPGSRTASGVAAAVNWLDFDNDGLFDLFVKNYGTPTVLYRNNGDGTFTDVAEAAGLDAAPGDHLVVGGLRRRRVRRSRRHDGPAAPSTSAPSCGGTGP